MQKMLAEAPVVCGRALPEDLAERLDPFLASLLEPIAPVALDFALAPAHVQIRARLMDPGLQPLIGHRLCGHRARDVYERARVARIEKDRPARHRSREVRLPSEGRLKTPPVPSDYGDRETKLGAWIEESRLLRLFVVSHRRDHLDEPGFARFGANPDGARGRLLKPCVGVDELGDFLPRDHARSIAYSWARRHDGRAELSDPRGLCPSNR
jgi:hypothetical protein